MLEVDVDVAQCVVERAHFYGQAVVVKRRHARFFPERFQLCFGRNDFGIEPPIHCGGVADGDAVALIACIPWPLDPVAAMQERGRANGEDEEDEQGDGKSTHVRSSGA